MLCKYLGCVINSIMQLINCNSNRDMMQQSLNNQGQYNYIYYVGSLICNVPVVNSSKIIIVC